jgi:hypothetical protein
MVYWYNALPLASNTVIAEGFQCLHPVQDRANVLHRELLYDGIRVDSINAAQSHTQRAAAIDNFRFTCGASLIAV